MKNKKRSQTILTLCVVGGAVFLIGVWYIVSAALKGSGNNVLPYPHETLVRMFQMLFMAEAKTTWTAVGWTIARLLIGFTISFILAFIFGSLAGLYEPVKRFFMPLIAFTRTLPTAAVVIILLAMLFTPRDRTSIDYIPSILTVIVAFPLMYEAFITGMRNLDKSVEDSLRVESPKRSLRAFFTVRLPAAAPYVGLSLIQSIGLSLKVCIMSEVITSTSAGNPGIGKLIAIARTETGAVEDIIAYSMIALLIIALVDIIGYFIKKFVIKPKLA